MPNYLTDKEMDCDDPETVDMQIALGLRTCAVIGQVQKLLADVREHERRLIKGEKNAFEKGKSYWVLVGDEKHEPTPHMMEGVNAKVKVRAPDINFIVTPYYIRPYIAEKWKKKCLKRN